MRGEFVSRFTAAESDASNTSEKPVLVLLYPKT